MYLNTEKKQRFLKLIWYTFAALTLMHRTGPKISSFQSLLVSGTSTSTVGGMKNPVSCTAGPPTRRALKSALGSPPQRKVRFSSLACAMKLLTRSNWPLLTMGP